MRLIPDDPITIETPLTEEQQELSTALAHEEVVHSALLQAGSTHLWHIDPRRYDKIRQREIDRCAVRGDALRQALKKTIQP